MVILKPPSARSTLSSTPANLSSIEWLTLTTEGLRARFNPLQWDMRTVTTSRIWSWVQHRHYSRYTRTEQMQLEEATKIGRYLINGSGISDVDLYCYRH